jgi:hypothetical protein
VRANPHDPNGVTILGLCLEAARRPTAAEAALRHAVRMSPDSDALKGALGCFLLRRNDTRGAMEMAAQLGADVEDHNVLLLRGHLALAQGRPRQARDFALWALKHDATEPAAKRLLTLARIRQNPILALWWRYARFMGPKPIWLRLMIIFPIIAASLVASQLLLGGPWLLLVMIAFFAGGAFISQRMLDGEVKKVQINKGF